MLETLSRKTKEIFKDFSTLVGNLFLKILSYVLQVIAVMLIFLITILVINALLILKLISKIKQRSLDERYGETNVYSKIL